jgi:Flp pilus assembly CpaF family ATPase
MSEMTRSVFGDDASQHVFAEIRADVTAKLSSLPAELSGPQRDEQVRVLVAAEMDAYAKRQLDAGLMPLDPPVEQGVARAVVDALTGLGGLQQWLEDDEIEEIDVNGDRVWLRYAGGRKVAAPPVAPSDAALIELIRTIAARTGGEERRFDRGSPELSLRLPDGSRLFAIMAVTERPAVSIRRHRLRQVTLDDLMAMGTLGPELRGLFEAMVTSNMNLVVSGGTQRGKSTMVWALAEKIPPAERIITVEDTWELSLNHDPAHPDVVAMQARGRNVEGEGVIDQAALVRAALRMGPDRLIVGEVRGPEALPMLMAMSQGNDGSMSTVHASDARQALSRLATYTMLAPEHLPYEAACALVAGALHFVIHLELRRGQRFVAQVLEVQHAEGTAIKANEIFRPGPDGRAAPAVPMRTDTLDRLVDAGFDPSLLARR